VGRFPQPEGVRGSLRWVQHFVNKDPDALETAIGVGPINWCSPLASDGYAEYRDSSILDLLKVKLSKRPLSSFWPARGPQWDALGRAASGELILVEAKAHVAEILSPGTKASEHALERIRASLAETAAGMGAAVPGAVDWSQKFYQYTNRLAHVYFFRKLNDIPALLIFLYFIGDREMNGPASRQEWEAATAVLHEALGLRGRVPLYVKDAFVEVPASQSAAGAPLIRPADP
jgi:hypothetical protein